MDIVIYFTFKHIQLFLDYCTMDFQVTAFMFDSTYLNRNFIEYICLINTHILIYRHSRCNWSYSLILLCFFWYFYTLLRSINVWIVVSPPNYPRLCVWLIYTFWNVNIPNVPAGYGRFSDLTAFFLGIFIYYYMFEALKLHRTFKNCVLRQKCRYEK